MTNSENVKSALYEHDVYNEHCTYAAILYKSQASPQPL